MLYFPPPPPTQISRREAEEEEGDWNIKDYPIVRGNSNL